MPARHAAPRAASQHRARPGTVRLWTIQPVAVWDELRCRQSLYVDLHRMDESHWFEDLHWQYDWMREQMARRLPHYEGHYPWWAYLRPKPDLRQMMWDIGPCGARYVRLELAIEPCRLLLSNLEAWFNGMWDHGYVAIDHADYDAWAMQLRHEGYRPSEWPLPEPWHSRRVASWERIFDLELLAGGNAWTDMVQATFERLELSDVVAVTEFTARGRPPGEKS